MAKKFAGFTPEQLGKMFPEVAGMQGDEAAAVLAASPKHSAQLALFQKRAQAMLEDSVFAQVGGYINPAAAGARQYLSGKESDSQNQVLPTIASASQPVEDLSNDVGTPPPAVQPTVAQPPAQPSPITGNLEQRQNVLEMREDKNIKARERRLETEANIARIESQLNNPAASDEDSPQFLSRDQRKALEERLERQRDFVLPNRVAAEERSLQRAEVAEDALSAIETPRPAEVRAEAEELQRRAIDDPASFRPEQSTQLTTDEQRASGVLREGVGQVGAAPSVTAQQAVTAPDVATPIATDAASYDVTLATPEVQDVLDRLSAATGRPSDEALAQAATMPPEELAQLGLSAAQIEEAIQVVKPDDRALEEGELISGSAVDMGRVRQEVNFSAATGTPSSEATVQGQLTDLLGQFEEGKDPPSWAAGAMRAATAALAQRGLSASSMAGQAVVQAAMESALPIAQADSATFQRFELQNLSNRQQAALFAAEQRASFLNLEFNQEFQTRVANAAKVSEIANLNFTADQNIALENARLAQTVDLANLDASNAKILSDAAAMSNIDIANLNNRQQAQVQQANAFLQMDMTSLSNEQQARVIKAQGMTNALLSDAAADNASKQFNASSQQQNDQFFSGLANDVAQFNVTQSNAMEQFNVNEANAINQFNASLQDSRDRFNASNALIIEQANAQWFQNIATTDNAAVNQANRDRFLADATMTTNAYNAFMQSARDTMNFAFNSAQNDADRATAIAVEVMRLESAERLAKESSRSSKSAGLFKAVGSITGKILSSDKFLDKFL